jgi:RNA polymerase sigma-70 factor (ECF subfamily)
MLNDTQLIIQFQAQVRKEEAFSELMRRNQQKVYYQIKRMVIEHADADDIAQQVWIKVWNKLDGFKMESEFSTWVFRIAYNETLNHLQKNKRNTHIGGDAAIIEYDQATASADGLNSSQIQLILERAVKELPEKQRLVFMLRYFDAITYEKIASMMGTTVGGAKANFHQAVKKIEKFIRKD